MSKSETKKAKLDSAIANISMYQSVFRVLCDNKSSYIQRIRRTLRSQKSEIVFGKYKMIQKVIRRYLSPSEYESLVGTKQYKKSDRVYFFVLSNIPREKVQQAIDSSVGDYDYEKKGSCFSSDLVIEKGPLMTIEGSVVSNTLFKDIKKAEILPVKMNEKTNNIEVTEDTTVGRRGEVISEAQEALLKMLRIRNKEYTAEIVGEATVSQ